MKDGGGGVRSNRISGSNDRSTIGFKPLIGNYSKPNLVIVGKARGLPIVKENIRCYDVVGSSVLANIKLGHRQKQQ